MSSNHPRCVWPVVLILVLAAANAVAERNRAPILGSDHAVALGAEDCSNGVVQDDGTIESGYGWVPSVVDGRYVQRFELADFRSRRIEEVCVCLSRTRLDTEMSFEVQLYRDVGGRPHNRPEASVEAMATAVPAFPDGSFYSIDVFDAEMLAPTDVFYLGVKWDPSVEDFFFICVDQSEHTPEVDGFFIDDRAEDWTSVLESNDPIFFDHRAMMIRARAAEGYYPLVPTLGTIGLIALVVMMACLGVALLGRRNR